MSLNQCLKRYSYLSQLFVEIKLKKATTTESWQPAMLNCIYRICLKGPSSFYCPLCWMMLYECLSVYLPVCLSIYFASLCVVIVMIKTSESLSLPETPALLVPVLVKLIVIQISMSVFVYIYIYTYIHKYVCLCIKVHFKIIFY